jgi:subtilase family serine protease
LKGSLHPLAQPQFDAGRVPANTKLNGISIVFSRSEAQEADLKALTAAQQNPTSPLFHQWLTPDQFAARFGMAQSDLNKVQNWLLQQGFSIDSVARSRNLIRFSGNVNQVERAFSTQMRYYKVGGAQHFAPSTDLTLPSALAAVVLAVRNLDDFRPKAQVIVNRNVQPRSSFTSSQSGRVFFAPGDIATVYDVAAVHSASYTGAGQSIAVVGQSAISVSDIENFQSAAFPGGTVKDPTQVLVPGTGSRTFYSNDETESDLDLEWSGAMAPGAEIYFVYTGSSQNSGVFDSLQYAIDEKIANIITISYGDCETDLGSTNANALEAIISQAAAQGQTVVAASGDAGSTSCSGYTNLTTTQQDALAVNYPASSQYVTGVGGTEITAADSTTTSGYWAAATNNTDNLNSALKYIPEIAWNDDDSSGLLASGGGKSSLFPKPSWQTNLTPADSARDVPDISFYSSPGNSSTGIPGYLYCTSDSSSWVSGQRASCNSGFRDASSEDLTVAGGTSFAAPIFAGMLALINQEEGYTTGTGNINATLYSLAANSAIYASAFHDITSGNNDCSNAGSSYCTGSATSSYVTGTGYDLVTGLGSIDLANLAGVWTANTSTLVGTSTTISATNSTPAVNTSDTFTITVVAASGTATPSGSVTLQIDGGTAYSGTTTTAQLNASNTPGTATATYPASFSTAGTHQIIAQYPSGAIFAASSGVVSVSVGGTSSGTGSFSISASPSSLNVTQGSSGTATITIVPSGGYTGTVLLTLNSSNNTALANLCYNFTTTLNNGDGSVAVSGTSPVTTQLVFDTLPADCGLVAPHTGNPQFHRFGKLATAKNNAPNPAPMAIAFAGLMLVGFLGRYSRKFSALAGLIALLAIGLTVTACGGGGGGSSTSTTPDPAKGTYTITVVGQDSASSTIPTATTTFTFVIQ